MQILYTIFGALAVLCAAAFLISAAAGLRPFSRERLSNKDRRFSWEFAIYVFLAVGFLDVVLSFLNLIGPEEGGWWEWVVGIPFWIINFLCFPLLHLLENTSSGTAILLDVLGVLLSGALFWATAAGFYFGRKATINPPIQQTPP
jgi:hypothetical protein